MTGIAPITITAAKRYVAEWHRHLPKIQGALFASALEVDDRIIAVAMACNPPPEWNGKRKIVIGRVAVQPGTDVAVNACSRLYASICQAAKALGWKEAWTYTLEHEPGTSLRAVGFTEMGMTDPSPAGWNSPSKPRGKAVCPGPKRRWMRIL